jgi:hypothetical protein
MDADDFDLRKTGRFQVPKEDDPREGAKETTQKRERPTARPPADPKTDPAFDRRRTQLFIRPVLLPEDEAPKEDPADAGPEDGEAEPTTGEFVRSKTRRSRSKKKSDQ